VMDTKDIENSIKVSEASVNSAQTSVNTAQNNLNMANGASMQTQLQNAKNSITNAESSLKNAQTAVDNAQLALDNAKINLEKAETEYNNNVELFEVGGISEETMNNSKDSYEQAKNQYSQSELSLQQSQNQYNSAQDSLSQAQTNYDILVNQTSKENIIKAQDSLKQSQAQLESSKTQLTNTRQNLDDAYVKSPISGVVSQCNVTAGANLSQSASPFVIINTDSVDVKVNVAEQMVNSIKAGDGVRIKVSTLSDEYMNGNISYVSPDANSDGTYEVKVNIPNGDGRLKSGMFAEVYFTKEKSDNAVVIDRDSVVTKDGESYVFVVEGDTAKKTVVEIGIDNGDTVEITSGLSQGMTIVTEGQTYLTDGDKINDVTNKKANNNSAKQETQNDMPQGNMPKRN
ncbi:MAG: efflux RND transporter periplasmic adaptor subunit, partial [Firmicutes bacterium]|nr:efflux RND transporter periplasmic adaptor subunit [Bacillota bacterium]